MLAAGIAMGGGIGGAAVLAAQQQTSGSHTFPRSSPFRSPAKSRDSITSL
nr:hypothetical protein [Leucobacter coleopterorum]